MERRIDDTFTNCKAYQDICIIPRWHYRYYPYMQEKLINFDVQEIRLGGLLLRLESCKARLIDFTNGKINKIEELEEEIIPLGKKQPKEANIYQTMSTVNVI